MMEPLAVLTNIMSGSKYVTVSEIKALLFNLDEHVLAVEEPDDKPNSGS